eukprot:15188970-Alexandrium_andersonii.AAC.1
MHKWHDLKDLTSVHRYAPLCTSKCSCAHRSGMHGTYGTCEHANASMLTNHQNLFKNSPPQHCTCYAGKYTKSYAEGDPCPRGNAALRRRRPLPEA